MKKNFFGLIFLFCINPIVSHSETITFLAPETPGLITSRDNGKMINKAAIDFIHVVASRAGVVDMYEIAPLAKAYELAEHQSATCAMGIGRDNVNESKFKWVGPIARQKMLLYANTNDKRPIRTLEDARGLVIGVGRKSAVASKLKGSGFQVEEAENEAINLSKLTAKKIDLWAVNAIPAVAAMRELNVAEPRLVTIIGTIDGYIACNRQLSDTTIEHLNNAVRSLEKSGEMSKMGL